MRIRTANLGWIGIAIGAAVMGGCLQKASPRADGPSAAAPDPAALRVMSFNILDGVYDLQSGPWEKRKTVVVDVIKAFDPDLLGAQEVLDFQGEYLRRQLPGYGFVGVGRGDGVRKGECSAIFFKTARFDKLDEGHFWLSQTPDVPGSMSWMCTTPRIVSWVKLRCRAQPQKVLYFFDAHYDPISGWAQSKSSTLLRQRIAAMAGTDPVILVGDFNCRAGARPYRMLLGDASDAGLRMMDSYREVHPARRGNEGTWHTNTGLRVPRRLDWILYTAHFRAVAADIVTTRENGRYPSDHFPVTAVLQLEPPTGG